MDYIFVEHDRGTQPALFNGLSLQGAVECCSIGLEQGTDLIQTNPATDDRILALVVGQQIEFGNLFVERHLLEQVLHTQVNGLRRVFIEVLYAILVKVNPSLVIDYFLARPGYRRGIQAGGGQQDIVMLHFIHGPFIPRLNKGVQPDVILNHERVANHYAIPSINLAEEVARRMSRGQFDWEQFGGTHPAWDGHKIYAAAINRLFDLEWQGEAVKADLHPHALPAMPLDPFSYDNGQFVPITAASQLNGWKVVDDWAPTVQGDTRPGFVHVPMLVAEKAGASLSLSFEGRAIGIFCATGPQAGVLEYSIDGAPYKKLNTYTPWSPWLYIPWVFMLETELEPTRHTSRLRMAKGERTGCQIRQFVINGK